MAANKLYSEDNIAKGRVVVVASPLPLHNKAGDVLLTKLLTILLGTLDKVSLVSGNLPSDIKHKDDINVWTNVDYDTRCDGALKKVVKYGLFQLKYSLSLFQNRSKYDTTVFWIASGLLFPVVTSKMLRKRTIVMATGNISNSYLGFFERANYLLSDVIGVESRSVIPYMGLQKYSHKIKILHLFVDPSFMIQKELKKRENVVGFVGRLSKEKGIVEFLDAINILLSKNSDVRILIGGSGPLNPLVEESVEIYGDRVCFLEWIPYKKMASMLNSVKLLVLPSYSEGLPNTVLEAMACGTPVLATPVGGVPDVVIDSKTGFIMKNNSPECIVENMIRALNSPDLEQIAETGRRLVEEQFSFESTVARWKEVLEEG